MRFYTNWFSPFARKVALALDYKGLDYETIDGLAHKNLEALRAVNPRAEVPTLVDGDLIVTQSAFILAYLDDAYPERPIFPGSPADRAKARALEYLFDTRADAILIDGSLWRWAQRDDQPPDGLIDAARKDLNVIFQTLEDHLANRNGRYAFGDTPCIVEFALWPPMTAVKPLGYSIDETRFPAILDWLATLKQEPLFSDDTRRTRDFLKNLTPGSHETRKIAWRGDRIEWLLARGFHDWFYEEIKAQRVIYPAAYD